MFRVTALFRYPVKSCRGIAVPSAEVAARGFADDRRFLLVDGDGRFLTQRAHPRMALIDTALTGRDLVLSSAGHGSISVPLHSTFDLGPSTLRVTIWRDTVAADDCGNEAAAWLSAFLGFACRLVYAGAAYARPVVARKLPPALRNAGETGSTLDSRPHTKCPLPTLSRSSSFPRSRWPISTRGSPRPCP